MFLLWHFILGFVLFGQDSLFPLRFNPAMAVSKESVQHRSEKTFPTAFSSLSIPFFDDFARRSFRPDTGKWLPGSAVYINTGYPRAPFTIGARSEEHTSELQSH